jgi:hypothetical protein
MVDSKEFAVGVFDALARRRRLNLERISKDELHDFWLQISDQSFDARLQIFFDMYVQSCLLISPIRAVVSCVSCFMSFQGRHQSGREDHEGGSAGG